MTGVPSISAPPDVSVVMSVYNGSDLLAKALDSILAQEGVTLELIVVNDGSTDDCAAILDEYARRDPRVRVIHQDNTGLTRALIRGCAAARGQFIARQDADDISLPGRLAHQVAFLNAHPEAVMTASGVRRVGPGGEDMGEDISRGEELHEGLGKLTLAEIAGPPHHGSTMFRRSAYEAVGGYRAAFRVAQDLDLWLRLAEVGKCLGIPDILYQASWRLGAISHLRRQEQVRTTEVLLECARVRRAGGSDAGILALWEQECVGQPGTGHRVTCGPGRRTLLLLCGRRRCAAVICARRAAITASVAAVAASCGVPGFGYCCSACVRLAEKALSQNILKI